MPRKKKLMKNLHLLFPSSAETHKSDFKRLILSKNTPFSAQIAQKRLDTSVQIHDYEFMFD